MSSLTDIRNRERRRRRGLRGLRRAVVSLLLVALTVGSVRSQEVPVENQLPIFFKLLTYDRTLWETPRSSLRIGLLQRHDSPESRVNLAAMVAALNAASDKTINGARFDFTTLTWSTDAELEALLAEADIDVLYVTAGHASRLDVIGSACRLRSILTLASVAGDVAEGLSVGIALADERPRIRVNLQALAAEGHQLDARVLRLCEVVDR